MCVLCTMRERGVPTLTDKFKSTLTIRFLSVFLQFKRHKINLFGTAKQIHIISN